jgi:hypothetical protein
MQRRLFGARKGRPEPPPTDGWPRLPGALEAIAAPAGLMPHAASAASAEITGLPATQAEVEEELLERIAGFRAAVADCLYGTSQDYQILSSLMQADLAACSDIVAELNRRLAGNIHFRVLAKLDEVHALVAAHVAAASSIRDA